MGTQVFKLSRKEKGLIGQTLNIGVPKGIRTPVTAVKGRCPRPLDDGDLKLFFRVFGGARRDRTADLLHAMQALSQLSYSPRKEAHIIGTDACPVNTS